jgi:hypothetical protein
LHGGDKRNTYKALVRKLKERDHSEERDVIGRIILEWILERYDGVVWTGLIWLRIGTSGGLLLTW